MRISKAVKLSSLVIRAFIAVLILAVSAGGLYVSSVFGERGEWDAVISEFFRQRNACVLRGELDVLKIAYLTSEKNGLWAFENEQNRSKALSVWAEKQGVTVLGIESRFVIKRVKKVGRGYSFYIVASNEYSYVYNDDPDGINIFRIGTYHSLDLIPACAEGTWTVSREWYSDPFSSVPNAEFTAEISEYISSMTPADLTGMSPRRQNAVDYADRYCGAASTEEYGFSYNKNYTDYNSQGGDCANFASQILFEGGGFKKTTSWNYSKGKGNYNWLKAEGFKNFLLYSGRASLLASGGYSSVYKPAFKLLPGDIVVYAEKGKISHVSVVTGLDSKGCPLVNCHNVDRYRVPWDIGWNGSNIKFYLLRMNY